MNGSDTLVWQVYLIRCRDDSLYTGITTDPVRRLREHAGEGAAGAKYLRGRGPFTLVFSCAVGSRAAALRAERRIKRLPKEYKERLVAGRTTLAEII
jgi:putative endonuclease